MPEFFTGLVTEGLVPVFLALLSFLPQVVILLTIVSLFENTGFILGFGCTTLAVSSIDSNAPCKHKHRMTRFLTFIPCSAKLPVLVFLSGVILGWTVFGVVFLYIFSILLGLVFGGYRLLHIPHLKDISIWGIGKSIAMNTLEFLKRISLGIIIAASVLYTLQYFSWLLPIAGLLSPLFTPLGLGSAAVIACLAFGLVAKEMIIGAVLAFGVASLGLTTASAISFLLFVLLYSPCIPALTAIRAKLGTLGAVKAGLFSFAVAYAVSFIAFNLFTLVN